MNCTDKKGKIEPKWRKMSQRLKKIVVIKKIIKWLKIFVKLLNSSIIK